MSELTIKQHFVPRAYLKSFSNLHTKDTYRTFSYDKVVGKIIPANILDIAQERFFYDFSDEFVEMYNEHHEESPIHKQHLEKFFNENETNIGYQMDRINKLLIEKNISSLTFDEIISNNEVKLCFATFIALQSIRNPSYRQLFSNFISFIFGSENEHDMNEVLFHHLNSGYVDRISDELINNYYWSIGAIINPGKPKSPLVDKCYPTDRFIISDNPVINIQNVKMKNGQATRSCIELVLPLNQYMVLILHQKNSFISNDNNLIKHMKSNDVRIYNEIQLTNSYRKVIFKDADIGKKIEKFFRLQRQYRTKGNGQFIVSATKEDS